MNWRFRANAPDLLWVADLDDVQTCAGFLYLAGVLDASSRTLVGWAGRAHDNEIIA
ncbi:hypothetical protein WG922_07390 [Ramlibacter sp. AN1015]|uniref:hypothetical protein n=1 Tax=Ramlibacter sp. AN1015 TaxID=3133428 RepID=UPI0030C1F878